MIDRTGQFIDDYRLVGRLGAGAFGEVYLGEHIHDQSRVAVKVLQLTQENLKGFIKETSTTFRLRHPHIMKLISFGMSADDTPYLIMDYASNGTLRERHPKGTSLSLDIILSYVMPLAAALQYAHGRRVVHRDVKPENVLLGADGQILLSDFGIAVVAPIERSLSTQNLGGTVAYMAPEQIRGKPQPASDQYALGIMVYEWLCGVRPFQGTQWRILEQQRSSPPPPLCEKCPNLPVQVEEIVLKALAKNPQDRFICIQDFATALAEVSQASRFSLLTLPLPPSSPSLPLALFSPEKLPGQPVTLQGQAPFPSSAPPQEKATTHSPVQESLAERGLSSIVFSSTSPSLKTQKHVISRRIILTGLVGVAGVSIAGGSLMWLVAAHNPKRSISLGLTATATTRSVGHVLYIYHGQDITAWSAQAVSSAYGPYLGIYAAVWSPDGTRIASSNGTVQIWDAADGGHVLMRHAFKSNDYHSGKLAWSPDGTRIVSTENLSMEVWTAKDGTFIASHQSPLGWGYAVSWSPDNQRIVSGSDEEPGSAEIWNAASGQTMLTYRGHISPVQAVAWSPNGKWIVSSSMGKLVHVWDATNAKQVYVYSGHPVNEVQSVAWSPDSRRVASAGSNGTVHVWDASSGNHVYIYRGHFHANDQYHTVTTVAWSPDGTRIASGDWNHLVQIWDAVSGNQLYTYRGHSDYITSVAWSPDSKRIASASRDGTIQVWQAS